MKNSSSRSAQATGSRLPDHLKHVRYARKNPVLDGAASARARHHICERQGIDILVAVLQYCRFTSVTHPLYRLGPIDQVAVAAVGKSFAQFLEPGNPIISLLHLAQFLRRSNCKRHSRPLTVASAPRVLVVPIAMGTGSRPCSAKPARTARSRRSSFSRSIYPRLIGQSSSGHYL